MRISFTVIATAFLLFSLAAVSGKSRSAGVPPPLLKNELALIRAIASREIQAGRVPGAVVEIGQGGSVVYRDAFGYRMNPPGRSAMTPDTIFDLASLTKVVATSVAIMQLRESNKIELDAPVAQYWRAFGRNGKESITVRDLLTHYSGLAADLNLGPSWQGYDAALRMIEDQKPLDEPGTHYRYSDINFEALGELVHRISGLSLDEYCRKFIFEPLGMAETSFRPPVSERNRIAPTGYAGGKLRVGEVHDPTAARMGGVAGHAGLFSTADDLAIFAQMMLDGGTWRGIRILSRRSIIEMTDVESPAGAMHLRGLGWDLGTPLRSNRDHAAPIGSYGQTGFTGTMLWIDPTSTTFVIILSNRTYLTRVGDAGPLRQQILDLVSGLLGPLDEERRMAHSPGRARRGHASTLY